MRFSITVNLERKPELETILADQPIAMKGFERTKDPNRVAFLYEIEGGIGSPDVDRCIERVRARIQMVGAFYQGPLPRQYVPYPDSMELCSSSS